MATNQQITECLTMLRSAFAATLRNSPIPADADAVYSLLLDSTPGDVLRAATLKIIATDTWYPTVARILEACRDVQLAAQPVHDWENGWRLCMQAANDIGCAIYTTVNKSEVALAWIAERDEVAAETIKRLGWVDFCRHETDQQTTWKAQFREAYRVIINREKDRLQLPDHVANQIMAVSTKLDANKRLAAPKK